MKTKVCPGGGESQLFIYCWRSHLRAHAGTMHDKVCIRMCILFFAFHEYIHFITLPLAQCLTTITNRHTNITCGDNLHTISVCESAICCKDYLSSALFSILPFATSILWRKYVVIAQVNCICIIRVFQIKYFPNIVGILLSI